MIELKPFPDTNWPCPECGSHVVVDHITIAGMQAYAECTCTNCVFPFYQMLPVSHQVDMPLAIGKVNEKVYNEDPDFQWLFELAQKSFPLAEDEVMIRKTIYHQRENVIFLNALDFLYGHVLLKLYNAQHHLDNDKDFGLILIIPKNFEWMVPDGCAEVWTVDLSLSKLDRSYAAISEFIGLEMHRFSKIYLSKAYSHPDFSTIDISRYTGISPFDLNNFYDKNPCITFVLREDRWWLGDQNDYWFYRICRKLKWKKAADRVLSGRQNTLVKSAISAIKKSLPDADFNIVGIGTPCGFSDEVHDARSLQINSEKEKEWCTIYSQSHVVIGFHGSNMLLPTAFAAGCVEILPDDRYGNMVQDISVRYNDRQQLFFYRFADQYASPESVAGKAVAIIRDYKNYHRNMCVNTYKEVKGDVDKISKYINESSGKGNNRGRSKRRHDYSGTL